MTRKPHPRETTVPTPRPPSVWTRPLRQAGAIQWAALTLLALGVLASGTAALAGWQGPVGWRWLEGGIPVLASVAVLAALAARLPLQNVLACGLLVWLTAAMVMAIGAFTGSPLGRFEFTRELGARLMDQVTWPVPFLWLAVVLSARQSARVVLRPWRRMKHYGVWLLGVALVGSLALALTIEPFGRQVLGWWHWPVRTTAHAHWLGAPLMFPAMTAVFTAALLLIATPWLIAKRPAGGEPDYGPVLTWLALDLWAVLGGLSARLWTVVALGVVAGGVVAVLAWHGGHTALMASARPETA